MPTPADTVSYITMARTAIAALPSLAAERVYANYPTLLLGGPTLALR